MFVSAADGTLFARTRLQAPVDFCGASPAGVSALEAPPSWRSAQLTMTADGTP
jgi:hypothetical protein